MFGKLTLLTCVYCDGAGTPDPAAARRQWASTAQDYLVAVTQAVDNLRGVFLAERETSSEAEEAVASQVVSACTNLNEWLRSGHAPRGFAKAGGELGAAAGVYRNAAVAFKSLRDVDGEARGQSYACATLLEQGDHHVQTFVAALAKKLGTQLPRKVEDRRRAAPNNWAPVPVVPVTRAPSPPIEAAASHPRSSTSAVGKLVLSVHG